MAPPEPVSASVESTRTVSVCPAGHGAGSAESAMGRVTSKVSAQSRHRKS
jgi:hypothetical protein